MSRVHLSAETRFALSSGFLHNTIIIIQYVSDKRIAQRKDSWERKKKAKKQSRQRKALE